MAKRSRDLADSVVVVGLGRFGSAVALEAYERGLDVLGVDSDPGVVRSMSGHLTHVVEANATSEEAMRQLSVKDFGRAVVGMGSDLEASILAASVLLDLGTPNVWANATTDPHARILRQLGVHHVVRPAHDMGRRVAHLVCGRMLDYLEFDDGYAIVKVLAPATLFGQALGVSVPRRHYDVTIVGVKRPGSSFIHATPETVIESGDVLVVSGERSAVERFAEL